MSSNINIIGIFRNTNLTVTIDIRTISDNELIVNAAEMTEMADGAYLYIFKTYDSSIEYLFICKDTLGNRVFATNDNYRDNLYKAHWHKKELTATAVAELKQWREGFACLCER